VVQAKCRKSTIRIPTMECLYIVYTAMLCVGVHGIVDATCIVYDLIREYTVHGVNRSEWKFHLENDKIISEIGENRNCSYLRYHQG
jgi:hypothetical protein